jgi:hypothetical protein
MRRRAGSLQTVVLALLVLTAPGWTAALTVSLVHLSSPVAPFSDATIQVKTVPGAACTITVLYKSGPSRARGLVPRAADRSGFVEWQWRVGSNTTPGQWPVVVTCEQGGERGELRALLEVR